MGHQPAMTTGDKFMLFSVICVLAVAYYATQHVPKRVVGQPLPHITNTYFDLEDGTPCNAFWIQEQQIFAGITCNYEKGEDNENTNN